ncbi:hypothetical protein YC2023_071320 [Brassica napus]
MGFSSTSSPKLLFRQLLKKKSSTFMYLLADVSHPEYQVHVSESCVGLIRVYVLEIDECDLTVLQWVGVVWELLCVYGSRNSLSLRNGFNFINERGQNK